MSDDDLLCTIMCWLLLGKPKSTRGMDILTVHGLLVISILLAIGRTKRKDDFFRASGGTILSIQCSISMYAFQFNR